MATNQKALDTGLGSIVSRLRGGLREEKISISLPMSRKQKLGFNLTKTLVKKQQKYHTTVHTNDLCLVYKVMSLVVPAKDISFS